MPYYAVHKGLKPGIYPSWDDCEFNIKNYAGARFKKFTKKIDAEYFVKYGCDSATATTGTKVIKKPKVIKENVIENKTPGSINVYTDGALIKKNNKIHCGYGIYIPSKNISEHYSIIANQTNNRAELSAIIVAIKMFNFNKGKGKKEEKAKLNIYTDSIYAIRIFGSTGERYHKYDYKKNGVDVKNKDLVMEAISIKNICDIQFFHVNSHTGREDEHSLGNDQADKLAYQGAMSFSQID